MTGKHGSSANDLQRALHKCGLRGKFVTHSTIDRLRKAQAPVILHARPSGYGEIYFDRSVIILLDAAYYCVASVYARCAATPHSLLVVYRSRSDFFHAISICFGGCSCDRRPVSIFRSTYV